MGRALSEGYLDKRLTFNFQRLTFRILGLFIIILISLLSSLYISRFSPDYYIYISAINLEVEEFNFNKFEPGFWLIVLLNQILFNSSPISFYFIFTTTILILFTISLFKYSNSPYISLITFLILLFPNHGIIQIRQGLAAGIWLLSIQYIVNRKSLKYIFCVIIAFLFHYSALILLPLYFLSDEKINKKFYYLLPFLGLIASYYIDIIEIIKHIISYLPFETIRYKLNSYIVLNQLYADQLSINRINLFNLLVLTKIAMYYFILLVFKQYNRYQILFIKILALSIFSFWVFASLPVLSFRLNVYFDLSLPIIIAMVYKKFKPKEIIFFLLFIYIAALGYNIYIRHQLFMIGAR